MGTDIHLYAEQRLGNGRWVALFDSQVFIWRDYGLFTRLAGVREREGVVPISQPRGMPADASETVREGLSSGDYHSHSWISGEEFTTSFMPDAGNIFWTFGRYVQLACRDYYAWRFVFAFDC
jgi:hypothetical protein